MAHHGVLRLPSPGPWIYPEETSKGPRTLSQSHVAVIDPRWRRPAMRKFYPLASFVLLFPTESREYEKMESVKYPTTIQGNRQRVPNSFVDLRGHYQRPLSLRSPQSPRHGLSIFRCPTLSPERHFELKFGLQNRNSSGHEVAGSRTSVDSSK